MDKKYLDLKRTNIEKVMGDKNFRNKKAKSSAQNILSKINKDYLPAKNILINPNNMFLSAFYLLYSIVDLINDDRENIDNYSDELKTVASIFESLSNISDANNKYNTLEKGETVTLSSITYNIAGYQANSHCLSNYALKHYELSPFYKCLNLLLLKDFDSIYQLITESKDKDLIFFRLILHNFVTFIHFGDSKLLNEIEKQIEGYANYFFSKGNVGDWIAITLLKPLIYRLEKNSFWTNIPTESGVIWREYVESLSFQKQPVIELWPSQIEAINKGLICKIDDCVIKMPTSSGKTLIAEMAILQSLIMKVNKKCIYIAPYKSLAVEVRDKLEKNIGNLGYTINVMYGEYDVDGFEDDIIEENNILVLTPEKLDLIIRENEDFIKHIGLIIVDEGHILNSGARGIRSEFLINRIRQKVDNVRTIFISAVFSDEDVEIMNKWLKNSITATSSWKPTTLHQGFFHWQEYNSERIAQVRFQDLHDSEITNAFYTSLYSDKILNRQTNRINTYPKQQQEISASLAIYFQKIGQTIVFCARKVETENVTRKMLEALEKYYTDSDLNRATEINIELRHIIDYLLYYFDRNSLLIRAMEKGIAFHHADLPDEVKQIIEKAFSDGKLRIICCTTTLAQGVNLPAINIIIHSINHYRDENKCKDLSVKDYWNICGRAGRAFHSTEGNVVFVPDIKFFNIYKNPKNIEVSISALSNFLLNTSMFSKVMEAALSKRFDIKKIYNGIELEFDENFDSLISQLIALFCEEIIDDEDDEKLVRFLKESLLYFEVSEDVELIKNIASSLTQIIKEASKDISKEKLKLFYSTGMNVESCVKIEEEAVVLMNSIVNDGISLEEIFRRIIEVSFSIKEIAPSYKYIKLKDSVNIADVLINWINYSHLEDLKQYFAFENDMHFYNFVNKTFIQKAPWGIHSFIKILENTFKDGNYDMLDYIPDYKYIASKVKYGVNDITAIFVCSLGIQNRTIAKKIANYYIAEGFNPNYKPFRKWFCELMNEDIMMIFQNGLNSYTLKKITDIRNKINYSSEVLMLKKKGIKSVITKVVGMFYDDRYRNVYKLEKGENLVLKREPKNIYDPNAIAVFSKEGNKIGYVERRYANYISTYLQRNYEYECIIKSISAPNPPENYGKIFVRVALIR